MEACGPSGWINDLCAQYKRKTLVCSTNEDAWKWSNVKRKTDKDDALKIARMAAMNERKAVHMPTPEHREFRSLVKYRKTLDQRINRIKNTIRSFFVNHRRSTPIRKWPPSVGLLRLGSETISIRGNRSQWTNHQTWQPARSDDPSRMRLGIAAIQPLGQRSL